MQFDVTLECGCDVTVECEMDREWRNGRYHGVVTSVEGFPFRGVMAVPDRCPSCEFRFSVDEVRDLCQQAHDRHEESRHD